MMNRILSLFFILFLLLLSCSHKPFQKYLLYRQLNSNEETILEIRELQTRVYDTNIKNVVLKAIMNTLQDDGYAIKNLDANLGYFNGKKESVRFINRIPDGPIPTKDIIEATVNVTGLGLKTKVRVSFNYICIIYSKERANTPISDPKFYQDFFAKVDKAIFIEKQKL